MKIKHKLFIAILSVAGFVLAANYLLARWNFDEGFRVFIGGLEQQRLSSIGRDLVQHYSDSGKNWDSVSSVLANGNLRLNRVGGRNLQPFPPRHFDSPADHRPPPMHRERPNKGLIGPPTALFDSFGNWVAGISSDELTDSPYASLELFDGDQKVGELRSWPAGNSQQVNNFSRQQQIGSLVVGLLSLLLAGLIAWRVAKRLTQPIDRLRNGVSDLASGNYELTFKEYRSDELGLLMDNLESLATTLDKNRSAKQRFFADISHELRTPLTILTGEIAALKAGLRPFDNQQLTSFEHEVERLNHLVSDLYHLSVSDLGGMSYCFDKTNISDCLLQTLESMKFKAEGKGLVLEHSIEPDVYVRADEKRIKQLLLNLCENSIVYTDAPGRVSFELSQRKDTVFITVNDTKPSAPIEECDLLMEPLYRRDESRTRSESGSGLGLAICKNIVEAHQGNITIVPSELGGLRIEICLKKWKGKGAL
jgi:two-component system sensor histidine kinase BaeS